MANPLEIRRRIRSVENTRQITRAMQLVAASRMARAQSAVAAARPYADEIAEVMRRLVGASGVERLPSLLVSRPIERTVLLVVTTNRGFCGGLNTNTLRLAVERIEGARTYADVSAIVLGRKGLTGLRNLVPIRAAFTELPDRPSLEHVRPIARMVIEGYETGEFDEVQLVYPTFVNTLVQRPTTTRLLPVVVPEAREAHAPGTGVIYEPDAVRVLGELAPRFVESVLFRSVLELAASEQSARMVAMRNATDNATELIGTLRLAYNKERQTRITGEILDIAAAANALAEQ
jgi:F-type H+-transporting ATPase subunit gamma